MAAIVTIDLGLSFDVKLILFDFRNQTFILKIFNFKNISKSYFKNCCERLCETLRKTWKLQRSDYAMWVVNRRFLALLEKIGQFHFTGVWPMVCVRLELVQWNIGKTGGLL